MTGKQQRTFGSFYFAIHQPLPFPFRYQSRIYLIGLQRSTYSDLDKLLADHLCFHRGLNRYQRIGRRSQGGSKQER